jgi:uncharacterized 2Fe-2S/4Fe-4S cluster protein (DUF4445 family)
MIPGHIVKILPHGRTIKMAEGTNLLAGLIEHSIFLRSDCGGRGACGKCAVEVIDSQGGHQNSAGLILLNAKMLRKHLNSTAILYLLSLPLD